MKGRKKATGRFESRDEMEREVLDRYFNTPANVADIARFARVSETTIHNILKHKKGRAA